MTAYGQRPAPVSAKPRSPRAPRSTDKRYRTSRWQRARLVALRRDLYRCQVVAGCQTPATVADHIRPVYDGMPDAEFFDPRNLRASCRAHNIARGFAATLERPGPAIHGDYSRPKKRTF